MESKRRQNESPESATPARPNWRPEVLDGTAAAGLRVDFDRAEIWRWLHARLEWIGGMTPEQARLTALLHWSERNITTAVQAARLEANDGGDVDGDRQAYLEYLAADHLTQLALDLDPLPDLEPRPA